MLIFSIAVVLVVLIGCGGGGAVPGAPARPAPVPVSFYGDSILSGSIKRSKGDGTHRDAWLMPRPVERINELAQGRIAGVDWSVPGATVQDARDGTPGMPFGPFAQAIQGDTSRVVVIGYATANALRYPNALVEYQTTLAAMVRQAQIAGMRVLLLGAPHLAMPAGDLSPDDSAALAMRLARFDDATKDVANKTGARFIDLRSVAFFGAADMADDVHPDQLYSDRLGALVAREVVAVVQALP